MAIYQEKVGPGTRTFSGTLAAGGYLEIYSAAQMAGRYARIDSVVLHSGKTATGISQMLMRLNDSAILSGVPGTVNDVQIPTEHRGYYIPPGTRIRLQNETTSGSGMTLPYSMTITLL